jgi:hypothetical protein
MLMAISGKGKSEAKAKGGAAKEAKRPARQCKAG